jgi:hypothetical protein
MLTNVTFSVAVSGVAGAIAQQELAGDFNGDGIADLAIPFDYGTGTQPGPILFFLGDGHGGFVDSTTTLFSGQIPTGILDARILGGDFNRDGRTDVIGLDFGQDAPPFAGGQSELFLSAPGGKMVIATANLPQHLLTTHGGAVGDINGDGNLDAVLFNLNTSGGRAIEILLGDGAGHFLESNQLAPASYQTLNQNPGNTWGALLDVNGDGPVDLVAGTWNASSLPSEVYLNNGGSFATATPLPLPDSGVSFQSVLQVQPLDLNGDGRPDLIFSVTNGGTPGTNDFYTVGYMQFLINDGGGHFHEETAARLPQSTQPNGGWIKFIQAIDLNGDNASDLVTQWWTTTGIFTRIYLNDGSGHFSPLSQTIKGGATAIPNADGHGHIGFAVVVGNTLEVIADDIPFSAPPPPVGTTADMILRHGADGLYEIYDIGSNALLAAYPLGQVGTDWAFIGLGGFFGNDTTDMLLRNSASGGIEVYDVTNNHITGAAFLGTVGLDWQVMGFGNFSSLGETDMILRNVNSGGVEVYDLRNNQIIGANFMGTVGLNWQFSGVGNFSSRGTSDMLLRDSNTGGLEVYDINSNQITSAAFIGTIGLDWQFSGVGNFSGAPGETDLLLRNSHTGGLEVYNIANNQLSGAAFIGTIGLDWQFAGIAPIHAPGASDLVLRNVNTGAFEVYNIAGNTLVGAASLGQVGLDWSLGGFAVDPPTGSMGSSDDQPASNAQLVQAMAGLGGGSGATNSVNAVPLSADTSQQTFLTPPHA